MTAAILLLLIVAQPVDRVEVCEVNQTPSFTQVILWRWQNGDHRVAQWWIVKGEMTVRRIDRDFLVRSEGQEFRCRSYRKTISDYDPEIRDRKRLKPENRLPYWEKS